MKALPFTSLALAALGIVALSVAAFEGQGDGPSIKTKPHPPRFTAPPSSAEYWATIRRTAGMVGDPEAQRLAEAQKLNVLNLTWEDTGRYKGSAVGPNISDMTIQVAATDPATRKTRVALMPVIRHPNFTDETADLDPRAFTLLVGNQDGGRLRRVSLYEFLAEPTRFLTDPSSWRGRNRTLLAPDRDSRVLVSAQACFLPIPKTGKATFNPVVFNYQSYSGDPAVLTILATRQGTSVTVIDNKRDAFRDPDAGAWGQRLFHNAAGSRASLTGERLSDFRAGGGNVGGGSTDEVGGMNMVLLIQVPLKQKSSMRAPGGFGGAYAAEAAAPAPASMARRERSDVEAAVIGHGDLEGPFTEVDDLAIERDGRFPIRVTVQFYKATSNGVVSEEDLRQIRGEIDRIYAEGDAVGSLVVGGATGRITEYDGPKVQPADWWVRFWERHERNTGETRAETIAKLRRLLGSDFMFQPVTELYLRDQLRKATPK